MQNFRFILIYSTLSSFLILVDSISQNLNVILLNLCPTAPSVPTSEPGQRSASSAITKGNGY